MPDISDAAYDDIQRIKSHHWRFSGPEKARKIENEIYNAIEDLASFSKKKQEFGWRVKNDDGMFIYFYDTDQGTVVYAVYNESENWFELMPERMDSEAAT
ncbi:type II toxin-antitoxin system RelE/ParE family toxin [Rhizobium bangladeshense]|uniref:type II toxin-antitoxin system RelE/ParE family toxin n=1 Tax=Rhizobium bangladeshense TaxID=1138189 RepID=UPI0007E59E80|nr:type II toxin-antitoxin system RelE/ParE family toxin [Rhizobium bangladeshense]